MLFLEVDGFLIRMLVRKGEMRLFGLALRIWDIVVGH